MRQEAATLELEKTESPAPDLRLLIVAEPWSRVFLRNLRDLLNPRELPPLYIESAPAAFWPDVFVHRKLPWRRFFQSGAYHVLVLVAICEGSQFLALQPHAVPQLPFTHPDVVYYTPSEYVQPIDTRRPDSVLPKNAHPEYSAQPVISVPPEADNRSQTIVAPPRLHLPQDVALPNIVALSGAPQLPIAPAPAVPVSEISRLAPDMDRSIIAPPPAVEMNVQQNSPVASQQSLQAPHPAVIAPPPALDTSSNRRLGELNIGRSAVIAPAPQLSVDEQRTLPRERSAALRARSPQVVAPPPTLGASRRSRSGGGMIALSLHPAVGAPPDPPAGNRRGNFAATPEGHRGASGATGTTASVNSAGVAGSGNAKVNGNLPSGLYVVKASENNSPVAGDPAQKKSNTNYVNQNLIASARPSRMSRTAEPASENKLSEPERAVFGNRKVYSLSLNMPNLNSAGGSWIVRFAALKPDVSPAAAAAASGNPSAAQPPSEDLSSPVATRKVDPAYPLELMRQNVAGTVILYGVIRADGTVANVRVLRSVDDRLDGFASEAIAKWQFQPATKNGAAVDVEATFWIPFRPGRARSNF
jgi:TonB family protein